MGLRFKILAAFYIVVLFYAYDQNSGLVSDVTGVFAALAGLLILCVIALWPNASRTDRVDRTVDGLSWADRIDVEHVGRSRSRSDL